jgi:hypothetical protein
MPACAGKLVAMTSIFLDDARESKRIRPEKPVIKAGFSGLLLVRLNFHPSFEAG